MQQVIIILSALILGGLNYDRCSDLLAANIFFEMKPNFSPSLFYFYVSTLIYQDNKINILFEIKRLKSQQCEWPQRNTMNYKR